MGQPDGQIAKLWRHEFEKNGIGYDEIVLIGCNLGELDRSEFIPNVFQLIGIVKKIQNDLELKVAHERGYMRAIPMIMSDEEKKKLHEHTKKIRVESLRKIRENLK